MNILVELLSGIFAWTLISYAMHWFAHQPSAPRWIQRGHWEHHRLYTQNRPTRFDWRELFLFFDNWQHTLDTWLTLTLPAIVVSFSIGGTAGWLLFGLHYVHEVFFGGDRLDHNANITGTVTRFFAIGQTHLEHHRNPRVNYGFVLTMWDRVFGTYKAASVGQSMKTRVG